VWPAGQAADGGAAGRVWSGPRHASEKGTPCAAVERAGWLKEIGVPRLPPDRDWLLLPMDPRAKDQLTLLEHQGCTPSTQSVPGTELASLVE
jgi:hypothetical protein